MSYNIAESGLKESLSYGAAYGHGVALTERPRCVFDTALRVELGVSGCYRPPLAELLKFLKGVVAAKREHRVEHW